MGQEIGKCCASEEIEEVIKRDGTQTLQLDNTTPAELENNNMTEKERVAARLNQHQFTQQEMSATIRIQAVIRGVLARKLVRNKLTDVTLNSFANVSQMTGMNERQMKKKCPMPDGSIYTGQVRVDASKSQEEWLPDGKGKIRWPNGDKYQGGFVAGKPHGEGAKTFAQTRTVIRGMFLYGFACGQGELQRENADREIEYSYKGEFLDDRQHGKGWEQTIDGQTYEGMYQKGKKCLQGKQTRIDGSVYEGDFKNDLFHGQGKLVHANGQSSYEGEWVNGQMHGQGLYQWSDGRRYQGEYKCDKKDGFGVYMWADGRAHYGMWKDGNQNGEGTKVLANMDMTKSFWLNGKKQHELQLSDAERQEIAVYIQRMHSERAISMQDKRRSSVQRSSRNYDKQRQRQNSARQSMQAMQTQMKRNSSAI